MPLPRLVVEVCLAFHLPQRSELLQEEGTSYRWGEGEVEFWVLWVSSRQGEREAVEGTWFCTHVGAEGTCPCNSLPCSPCVWEARSRSAWGVGVVVCEGEEEG